MIDKNIVTKMCIDDFAIKKRQRYDTIMVDIELLIESLSGI